MRPPAGFVYTKNRDRLLNVQVMGKFLEKLMGTTEVNPLLSNDTHRSRTDPADAVFSEGVSLLARTGAPIACPSSAAQRPIQ